MTRPRLIYAPLGKRLPPERRRLAFLRAFCATGSVSYAAACAGVDRTTPYLWRAQDPDFATAWEAGRFARRTHHPDLLTRPVGRMNDRMVGYLNCRAAGRHARFSTSDTAAGQAKALSDQGSDRL
ncbi:MAG: hypothetical protein K2Y40_14815 [Reyranella sp.]|nr:hypothetical protein [Reyranella sp.]